LPLQRPSPIPIADIDFLLFEDAADFRCKFIQHCPNCVIVQIAGVQRQHLTRKDGNGFAVVGRIGVQTPKAGQTVILIDPLLVPGNRYFERIETLFAAVAASGVERLPAERRYTQRERSLRDGIRVSDRDGAIVQKLLA
jgi:hypothetical protein